MESWVIDPLSTAYLSRSNAREGAGGYGLAVGLNYWPLHPLSIFFLSAWLLLPFLVQAESAFVFEAEARGARFRQFDIYANQPRTGDEAGSATGSSR